MSNADTEENTVAACPECDHAPVTLVAPGGMDAQPDAKGRYGCQSCSARFDVPTYRERKRGTGAPTSGTAKRLLDADPDDWPPDEA